MKEVSRQEQVYAYGWLKTLFMNASKKYKNKRDIYFFK